MEDTIRQKITQALAPTRLEIVNESHLHKGHPGDNGTGESHFRVLIASPQFAGLSRVSAQRLVYKALEIEMGSSIHALSLSILSDH